MGADGCGVCLYPSTQEGKAGNEDSNLAARKKPVLILSYEPNLLTGSPLCPIECYEGISRRGLTKFYEIENLETIIAKKTYPIAVAQMKFDRVVVGPFEAMHSEIMDGEGRWWRRNLPRLEGSVERMLAMTGDVSRAAVTLGAADKLRKLWEYTLLDAAPRFGGRPSSLSGVLSAMGNATDFGRRGPRCRWMKRSPLRPKNRPVDIDQAPRRAMPRRTWARNDLSIQSSRGSSSS